MDALGFAGVQLGTGEDQYWNADGKNGNMKQNYLEMHVALKTMRLEIQDVVRHEMGDGTGSHQL